jgi:nickel-type superoxide dismutase maturation protease
VRFPLGVAVVSGASMQPHLYAGDCVLLRRGLRRGGRARVGDVVLLRRPDRRELLVVKRVTALVADGGLWVEGDNPAASDDSRLFGPVGAAAIEGRVVWRYRPLHRGGRQA